MSVTWIGTNSSIGVAQTVTDDRGKTHSFSQPPLRVVSLSPVSTELLFAIGGGDRLVGRTSQCDYPKRALSVSNVGSLFPPDFEKILATKPDLILMSDGNLKARQRLETLGVSVFVLQPRTVSEISIAMRRLGRVMNTPKAAEDAASTLEQRINQLRIEPPRRPLVMYEVWPKPLTTAGAHTFLADIIHLSGGQNLIRSGTEEWPKVSLEWAVARNPAVILTGRKDGKKSWLGSQRPAWQQTRAVKNGHVFVVPDEDVFVRPGPRVVEAIKWLKDTLTEVDRGNR